MVWVLSLLLACGEPSIEAAVEAAPVEAAAPTAIEIAGFHAKHTAGQVPLLVDVRTQAEWDGGHVPGAVHIPMDQVAARLAELEPHKSDLVYVICASGGRSGRVSSELRNQGYRAVNVDGGTSAWKAAGYPLE